MNNTPDRTESVFAAAVALATAAERAAYLEQACAGDPNLRGRVEALLRAHERAGHLLDRPAPRSLESTGAFVAHEQPGVVIAGRYKLLEEIGEGGMGTVWVAEQTQPVKRKVAIKLIKAGMDSKSVVARFEAERQALAVMDHPNIAKVLDGGLTDTGRPYFVMEYVKGVPITQYCDTARLSVSERLNLFVQVCQAVQHAHQKGIIHRDLKPSNILVAPYDDKPVPKVIDFGLAKAMHHSLTEKTLHTAHETVLGTPLYMSPEQAQLNNLDVDTRSDIYSLGVLLYELLTGTTPLEKQRFKEAAWEEVRRIIREEEPPRPSARLSSTATLPSLAAGRQTEPARLTNLVRGELDWIVMKSLEKDRNRRYETANGFAADVLRHLAGEPVLAAPPSASYRLRKFVRKHRAGLLTATALGVLLVAGVAVSAWQAVLASQAEQVAVAAQQAATERAEGERQAKLDAEEQKTRALDAAVAEKSAKEQAQKRLKQVEKANDILGSIFENLDPREIARAERPLQAILVEKLGQAVEQLEGESIGDPLAVAAMQHKFGHSLLSLGEPGKAIMLLEKARATRQAKLGPEHPHTLTNMNDLALAYQAAGKLDRAVPLLEETLKLQKAILGPEHPHTLTSMNNLAMAYLDARKLDQALRLHEETVKHRKSKLGPEHPDTLTAMNNLAIAYHKAGKLDLALPLFEETLKLMKAKLGPGHPNTLNCMNNLALAYQGAGKLDLALPLFEETVKLFHGKLGPDHPSTHTSIINLGAAYGAANQGEKAAIILKGLVASQRTRAKPDDPLFAGHLARAARVLLKCRQYDTAEAMLREGLAIREKKEPDAWTTFDMKSMLGGALLGQKKYGEADPLLVAGYTGMKLHGPSIPPSGKFMLPEAIDRLIELYTATNKPDEVKKWQAEKDKLPKAKTK